MTPLSNPKSTIAAFLALPQPAKDWLSSESSVYALGEIANRLDLDNEETAAVSLLTLRLVTKDLNPQDFINGLSQELNVNFETAKTITQDIEEKILMPIESELRKIGVNLNLLYSSQKDSGQMAVPPIPQTKSVSPETAPPSTGSEQIPFMLHSTDETNLPTPQLPPRSEPAEPTQEQPSAPFGKIKPAPNLKIKNYEQSPAKPKKEPGVPVRLETPPRPYETKIPKNETRVVHYGGLRTPLTPLGYPKQEKDAEHTVDLRKLKKPDNENTVDLRNKK